MRGIAPAQLLDNLECDGLRPFGVIAPQVDVRECPAIPVTNLGTQTVHVIIGAVDANHVGPRYGRPQNLARFQTLRNKDVALKAKPRRMRGHTIA